MRRLQVFQLFQNEKIDVLMLQETHANQSSEDEWCKIFKGCLFFSSALVEAKAGVAIVLHPRLQPSEITCKEICKGYLLSVQFVSSNLKICMTNVYCPSANSERGAFLYKLAEFVSTIDLTMLLCLGGDYNCTLNPQLDRNTCEPHPPSARPLAQLVKKFKLVDVWRVQNRNIRQYTWVCASRNVLTMARLDRFYVNHEMVNIVKNSYIRPSGFSDHHMIVMVCGFPHHVCGSAYWTFNLKLLQSAHFIEAFKMVWEKCESQKGSYLNLRQWWDCTKSQIKCFCQQYCSYSTYNAFGVISALKNDILICEQKAGLSSVNVQQLSEKRTLLAEMVKERAAGAFVRLRNEKIQLDTPNKGFFNLEKMVKTSQQIHALRSSGGDLLTSQSDIKHELQDYFSKLFAKRAVNKENRNAMLEQLPSLSEDQQQLLEPGISLGELTAALKDSKDGKAPGLDGLPAEFYKAFWDILGPTLLEVFQESVEQGELPLSCRRAVLCLLPKKGNLHETANWRPVSLLNTDYKILSKALATHLKEVISFLIGTDQSYFVPERSIYDNNFLVRLDQSRSNYISWFWFITFRSRKSF